MSCSESITSVGKEGGNISSKASFTFNYVVSVRRSFLFFLVLWIDHVILLWHSLGLPYDSFVAIENR